MKRWLGVVLAIIFLSAVCLPAHAAGTYTLTITPNGLLLSPGETKSLNLSITPVNLIDHTVLWSSDNEYIASVSANGKVTGHAAGSTLIRARIESGDTAAIRVTVSGNPVTSLAIVDSDIELKPGMAIQMEYTINQDADDQRIRWQTDDPNVATVDEKGLVTAVGSGTAIITLTAVNGMTATASIYVPSEVNSIMLDPSEALLNPGEVLLLDAYIFPGNARDRSVQWASSNESVATVDKNGRVQAKAIGQCTITCTSSNGVEAQTAITVSKIPKTLEFDVHRIALSRENRTYTIAPIITPQSAADCVLVWKTSDESVVTVKDGRLTAAGNGSATVTATSENGLTDTCLVYVGEAPSKMEFAKKAYDVDYHADGIQTELIFTPEDAFANGIRWSVDDPQICSVDENGYVKPLEHGTATLTAVDKNGLTASTIIRVSGKTESIAFDADSYMLKAHTSHETRVISMPVNSPAVSVMYTSSNPDICAIVDGVLYARKPGTALITARTIDGAHTCECGVTVVENPLVQTKYIALTFDNGPAAGTQQILEVLKAYGADATFFLLGSNVQAKPELAALLKDTNHEIGNHTYTNSSLNNMTLEDIAKSLQRTDNVIQKAIGRRATVLRAPDAKLSVKLFTSFLDERTFVGWSQDSGDMVKDITAQEICDRAYGARFDSAILVFHDAAAETPEALSLLLPRLILDGYDFVTASELIEITGSTSAVFTTKP